MAVPIGIWEFDLRRPRAHGDFEMNCPTIPSVADYTLFLTTEVISPRAYGRGISERSKRVQIYSLCVR